MKMVLALILMFLVTGRLSTRVNTWTLTILFTGIVCILVLRRITF